MSATTSAAALDINEGSMEEFGSSVVSYDPTDEVSSMIKQEMLQEGNAADIGGGDDENLAAAAAADAASGSAGAAVAATAATAATTATTTSLAEASATCLSAVNGLTHQIPISQEGKGIRWAPNLVTYFGSSTSSELDHEMTDGSTVLSSEGSVHLSEASFDPFTSGDGMGSGDLNTGMREMSLRQVSMNAQQALGIIDMHTFHSIHGTLRHSFSSCVVYLSKQSSLIEFWISLSLSLSLSFQSLFVSFWTFQQLV
jgi:hypothetical protein